MWDGTFRTPGSNPLGMGSQKILMFLMMVMYNPSAQTLIFRNLGINTDKDSVLVGVTDGDEMDIMVSGIIHHYIGISSTKKLVHHWGEIIRFRYWYYSN